MQSCLVKMATWNSTAKISTTSQLFKPLPDFLRMYHNPAKEVVNQLSSSCSQQIQENRRRLIPIIPCKMQNFFDLTERNVVFHHALLKFSQCCNNTLPKLVHIMDWYSIGLHTLLRVLQHPNSAVPSSSSLNLEQKSISSITETCG